MRLLFTSISDSGVDSNVQFVTQWLAQRGHTVHIVYPQTKRELAADHPRIIYHIAPISRRYRVLMRLTRRWKHIRLGLSHFARSYANARIIVQLWRAQQFDLAELNELNFHVNLLANVPYVYKMHGADWLFSRYCEDSSYYTGQMRHQQRMMRKARQVHTVSRSQAAFVAGACNFPPSRIFVTPNPLDTRRYRPPDSVVYNQRPTLMSTGRLEARKGHATLVRAMPKVWAQMPEVELLLHKGRGDYGVKEMQALLDEVQAGDRIKLLGYVPEETLIANYQRADVYVTATRYETFGYTILEAMACGRPVIATDIGPIPDLVRHEETGWLVPRDDPNALAETILAALRQPEKREVYGKAARRLAERFDVDVLMPRQVALYEKALK
jgi:glycosyltransferase involved in cell wall biosynthesis